MLKNFFKENIVPIGLYMICLLLALIFILNTDKNLLHISINNLVGNKIADKYFYYITYTGDGIIAIFILLTAFFINIRLGIYLTLSFVFAGLTTNVLKYQLFDDSNRPFFVFQWVMPYQLKTVDGVELMIHNSFPSGHATQSFAIFFGAALALTKNHFKILLFIIAVSGAFSRVYLSQHWLQDVTAGSAIGVFYSLVFYFLFYNTNHLIKFNKPLLKLFRS